jgi:hypothetical protein
MSNFLRFPACNRRRRRVHVKTRHAESVVRTFCMTFSDAVLMTLKSGLGSPCLKRQERIRPVGERPRTEPRRYPLTSRLVRFLGSLRLHLEVVSGVLGQIIFDRPVDIQFLLFATPSDERNFDENNVLIVDAVVTWADDEICRSPETPLRRRVLDVYRQISCAASRVACLREVKFLQKP